MQPENCDKKATILVFWPGEEPQPMCGDHAAKAEAAAGPHMAKRPTIE